MENKECESGSCKVVPFGQDWHNELMKWKKKDLVDLIKSLLLQRGFEGASEGFGVSGEKNRLKPWN